MASNVVPLGLSGNTYREPQADARPVDGVDIDVQADNPDNVEVDPKTGAVTIYHDDGSVTIDPDPQPEDTGPTKHFDNLADKLTSEERFKIADELLRGIALDESGRQSWLDTTDRGIELLGLELKQPNTSLGGSQEGTSKIYHPILLESCLRFQANARGELLPVDGPVKVRNTGAETEFTAQLAEALEKDLNRYLTVTATEYYPDTDRLLFSVGFRGCGFKKVYNCPIRRRPVSASVDAKDLIVSNAATDMKSCGRVTQAITMRPSTMKRMQLLGVYRDVDLSPAIQKPDNQVDQKIAQVQGIQKQTAMEEKDRDRDLYECYTELDLKGFEHKEKGELTGLPLPYKVTIDRDSREILEITRNWDEDDEQALPLTVFVKYPFCPSFGFYDIGLLAILGNTAQAATAGWRLLIDAGMFSCFPGFLYAKALGRQLTNDFRIAPGSGMAIDIQGMPNISSAVMPLPYKGPDPALMQLVENVVETGQRVGGTAELQVGEGRQDAPVGTTLALIEQATKTMDAVHKRIHAAQAQEFELLRQRFMEDPAALWRHNKKSATLKLMMQKSGDGNVVAAQEEAEDKMHRMFVAALENCELVPQADPNTSSQMSRLMKAVAVKQLQAANPELYDARAVDERILHMIGWDDVDDMFAPPQPPQADPNAAAAKTDADAKMVTAQAKLTDSQTKAAQTKISAATAASAAQGKAADIASKEKIAELNVRKEMIIHSNDRKDGLAQQASDNHNAALQQVGEHVRTANQLASDNQHATLDRMSDNHNAALDRAVDQDQFAQQQAAQQQKADSLDQP